MSVTLARLAIHGGPKAVQSEVGDLFAWPIITEEDEQAALEVLRAATMSDTEPRPPLRNGPPDGDRPAPRGQGD
jgi:hypothetical protein